MNMQMIFLFNLFLGTVFLSTPKLFADGSPPPNQTPAFYSQNRNQGSATAKNPQEDTGGGTFQQKVNSDIRSVEAFTGKVTKNRVRLRLQPSLESSIVRELNEGDTIVVAGETDDFYAIEPPTDVRAYVYRTYVLDGAIEGSHVNIRLTPDLTAPVIEQMNTGDPVNNGVIYAKDKHWIEFTLPPSVKFYVAKDYVKKIGDRYYAVTLKRRQTDVKALLSSATVTIQSEMQKPFDQIRIEDSIRKLNQIIKDYSDFPEESNQAKTLLASTQESYMRKKIASMEQKLYTVQNQQTQQSVQTQTPQLQAQQQKQVKIPIENPAAAFNSKMATWQNVEQEIYENWAKEHPDQNATMRGFYQQQEKDAVDLTGILEVYTRSIQKKPGDFILVNPQTNLPIAYLYSTHVDLQGKVGQVVTLKAAPRNNNNFAFPAYYVLSVNP